MRKEKREISLPEGKFTSEFVFFEEKDRKIFKEMFLSWVNLCKSSLLVGSTRIINFPEALSEAIFSLEMGVARSTEPISGTSSSFDNYDFTRHKRIQLKSATSTGPSSFGPSSTYDEIYFLYMREIAESKTKKRRVFSGKFEIYQLDPKIIPEIKVNKKQTFEEQQKEHRRPRFVIPTKIIKPLKLKPIKTGDIENW